MKISVNLFSLVFDIPFGVTQVWAKLNEIVYLNSESPTINY